MHKEENADGPCVTVRVPAKVNLFLAVRGRRPDGYHALVTVMQTVSVYDELRAGVYGPPGRGHHPAARRSMRLELLQNPVDGLPPPMENLAMRAARALAQRTGVLRLDAPQPAHSGGPRTVLDLVKGIPVAGGMAGGSADAAAALLALNELWRCDLTRQQLRDVAAELGSDVPFCVVGGTAIATSRGEALAQVLSRGTYHWVVATAHEPLPTAQVYAEWDRSCASSEVEPDAVLQALRNQDAEALGAALYNDLEGAAFLLRPALREQKQMLLDAGALGAVLAGSGPTLLALCEDARAAHRLAEDLAEPFARTLVAQSPAGGPDVLSC